MNLVSTRSARRPPTASLGLGPTPKHIPLALATTSTNPSADPSKTGKGDADITHIVIQSSRCHKSADKRHHCGLDSSNGPWQRSSGGRSDHGSALHPAGGRLLRVVELLVPLVLASGRSAEFVQLRGLRLDGLPGRHRIWCCWAFPCLMPSTLSFTSSSPSGRRSLTVFVSRRTPISLFPLVMVKFLIYVSGPYLANGSDS